MDNYHFKVYLTNDSFSGSIETRRFLHTSPKATSYQCLRKTLRDIFPLLADDDDFTIYWQDYENDYIAVSSQREMELYFSEARTKLLDICRLYVKKSINKSMGNKVLHSGVVCDGCDNNIYGNRYKCIECPDYDLCSKCEGNGMHPDHLMLRFSTPQTKFCFPCISPSLSRLMRKNMLHACKVRGKKCPYAEKYKSKYKTIIDMIPTMDDISNIAEYATKLAECPMEQNAKECEPDETATEAVPSSSQTNNKQSQNSTNGIRVSKATQAVPENTSTSQERQQRTPINFAENLLKHVITNFEQYINILPLHIDDDINNATNTPAADKAKSEVPAEVSPNNASSKFPGVGKKLVDDLSEPSTSTQTNQKEPAKQDLQSTEETNNGLHVPMDTTASSDEGDKSEEEEWTILNGSTSPKVPSVSTSISGNKETLNQGAPQKENSPTVNVYPTLPKSDQVYFHPNPKIQQAVDAMMQMGFSNEGGWLTHLLVSKNGDISRALDVLQPAHP